MQKIKETFDLCVVITDLGAGGAQRVLMHLLPVWARQYRVTVITLSEAENDFFQLPKGITRFSIDGIKTSTHRLQGLWRNLQRVMALRRRIKFVNAPVVLSMLCATNILTVLATRGLPIHVVISERNDPSRQSFGVIWNQLRRWCYRYADIVTANSRGALNAMQTYVPINQLQWVPNPIRQFESKNVAVKSSPPNILAVGRLHYQKGYDLLLNAFAKFSKQFPQWQLHIVGDGPLKSPLQQLAAELGIQSAVVWHGAVDDPLPYYQKATMLVLASRHEGVPNVMLEAMSMGLPVIITDASPGPLEYIRHQHNGWVIPTEQIDAIDNAMRALASNPSLRAVLGNNAKADIQSFSIERVIRIWNGVLKLPDNISDENH